jgi:GT2 family glycosyltransferase
MTYYFTPTADDKNLGAACNHYMSLIESDGDWVCLTDRDTLFLSPNYHAKIKRAIKDNPDVGMLTCLTNRVGERNQCYKGIISDNPNIITHKTISDQLEGVYTYKEIKSASGFCMIIKKAVWNKIKFRDGMLGIDNFFSDDLIAAGYKIKVIEGIYMLHYYRLKEGIGYTAHLK